MWIALWIRVSVRASQPAWLPVCAAFSICWHKFFPPLFFSSFNFIVFYGEVLNRLDACVYTTHIPLNKSSQHIIIIIACFDLQSASFKFVYTRFHRVNWLIAARTKQRGTEARRGRGSACGKCHCGHKTQVQKPIRAMQCSANRWCSHPASH